MAALAAAVRPFAGGVPRRAATVPPDASEGATGMKPRRVVAPAQDPSVCLTGGVEKLYVPSQKCKMTTCNRNNIVETAAGDMTVSTNVGGEVSSARELLQKRLASELDVLHGLLKKAELISRCEACNGGAPATAGNGDMERFLAFNSKQPSEPMEDGGGNGPSVKRRKVSTLVEEKQNQVRAPPPRMSAEERSQFACRLSSLSGEVPGQIVEFLLKQFGDADAGGETEINIDSVEDSVLFEMKTQLDKFARERPLAVDVLSEEKDGEKLAEESRSKAVLEQDVKTGRRPSSRSSGGSDTGSDSASVCERYADELPALREALPEPITATSAQPPSEPPASGAAQSGKKAQDVHRAAAPRSVSLAGLIYRAKVRRELMEMEKAALPYESIHPRDLQRLGIAEYGHPSLMRQLGLFLKADDA